MDIFHCILTRVSHICDEEALWRATLSTKTEEVPISAMECRLYVQMNNYEEVVLMIDPRDPDTRKLPMRKKKHCPYNK